MLGQRVIQEPDLQREPVAAPLAAPAAATPTAASILALQRCAGNQAVARYIAARQPTTPAPAGGTHPAPPPAPGTTGGPGATSVLPISGEARILLSEGMTFPLGGGDLSDLNIGKGRAQTSAIPLGDSGFEASFEVGAHSPMRLEGQRIEVTPIVARISAEQIAQKRQELEQQSKESGWAYAGAAIGGIAGGTYPLAWALQGGPLGAAGAWGVAGGQLGADIAAHTIEQKFTAELEEAAIRAHFPLVYNPYVTLHLGVVKLSKFIDAELTLQTSWALDFIPFLALGREGGTQKGSRIEVGFTNGHLSSAAFNLVLTGGLDIKLNGMGMLSGSVRILRILSDEEKDRDPGVVTVPLFNTDVFDIIREAGLSFSATANLSLATGSDLKVSGESVSATPKAKSCWDMLLEMVGSKAVGDKVKDKATKKKSDDDRDAWHAGTEKDPIPIDYYKPLRMYTHTLTARSKRGKYVTLQVWPHEEYDELTDDDDFFEEGKHWKVGVANHNVPKEGKPLVRSTPGSRAQAEKWKRIAKEYEVDLSGAEVDHVIDLGLGGHDAPDNLWPIKSSDNQNAQRKMYDEQMVRAPWLDPGNEGKTSVKALPPGTHLVIRELKEP